MVGAPRHRLCATILSGDRIPPLACMTHFTGLSGHLLGISEVYTWHFWICYTTLHFVLVQTTTLYTVWCWCMLT